MIQWKTKWYKQITEDRSYTTAYTHLTSSQGTKTSVCAIISEPEREVSIQWMTFLQTAVLWSGPHPGWCFGFLSIPRWDSRHFPKPRNRATPCCKALASASETGLFSEHVVPSVNLEEMRNCRHFYFAHSFICSGLSSFYIPCYFISAGAYFLV